MDIHDIRRGQARNQSLQIIPSFTFGTDMQNALSQDRKNRLITLLITTLSSFLIPFMGSSIIIALPVMGREFEMNVITITWVTSAYILASASLMVPFGRLSDILGRKRIFLAGYIFFLCGSALSA
ncbi:MAG: MFS transporter [Syntrophales bacterium]|nr:MFS transporter [Syntrophales bacterium]